MSVYLFLVLWGCVIFYYIFRSIIFYKGIIDFDKVGTLALLCISSLLMGLNSYNPDYYEYEKIYNNINSDSTLLSNVEFLYSMFCRFGNIIGLDYQSFRVILSFIGCLLIYNVLCKYNTKILFPTLSYCITGYFFDYVQMRQFLAMSIVLMALPCLYEVNKKSIIKYTILILIATGVHSSSIVLLILLVLFVKKEKRIKVSIYICISIILFIFVLNQTGALDKFTRIFLEDDQVDAYMSTNARYHNSFIEVMKYFVTQELFLIIVLVWCKTLRQCDQESDDLLRLMISSNVLLCCFLPFCFFSLQFRRIFRFLLIPSFVAIQKSTPYITRERFLLTMVQILYLILYFRLTYSFNSTIVDNLITYNLLI